MIIIGWFLLPLALLTGMLGFILVFGDFTATRDLCHAFPLSLLQGLALAEISVWIGLFSLYTAQKHSSRMLGLSSILTVLVLIIFLGINGFFTAMNWQKQVKACDTTETSSVLHYSTILSA